MENVLMFTYQMQFSDGTSVITGEFERIGDFGLWEGGICNDVIIDAIGMERARKCVCSNFVNTRMAQKDAEVVKFPGFPEKNFRNPFADGFEGDTKGWKV